MYTEGFKKQYEEQGFVIVAGLIDPIEFTALQQACTRVIDKSRKSEWMHRRTVGRQFPPFGDETDADVWGVQHVMHPELGESAFVKWYAGNRMAEAAKVLLECKGEELQMGKFLELDGEGFETMNDAKELFNLLINPEWNNFALRWHRDDVSEKASEAEERRALGVWHHGIQWNTALYRDACLYVVPGSHKVPRTPEQRKHSETMAPPKDPFDMPGAIQVIIEPGETVFYNSNILHCATYDSTVLRATLHATIGDTNGGATRARNVLQHGMDWIKGEDFRKTLEGIEDDRTQQRAMSMWTNLLKMQESVNVNDLGYSLSN